MLKYLLFSALYFRYFLSNEKSLSENEAQAGIPGRIFSRVIFQSRRKRTSGAGTEGEAEGYELDGRTERSDHS